MKFSRILGITVFASLTATAFSALDVRAEEPFGFYSLSPAPRTIVGVRYPRNDLPLYRGTTNDQMSLERAIRAMLGDETAPVESLFYSTIYNGILGRSFGHAVSLVPFVQNRIREARAAGVVTESEAHAKTRAIVDEQFRYFASQGTLAGKYLDYRSGSYDDWPNDVVFTSINSPAAATYGPNIVVVRETAKRSIDLNFWNYDHSRTWYDYTRDAGEFSAPAYIPAEDIDGFQLRNGSSKSWHRVDVAFYRATVAGADLLVAVDGEQRSCLLREGPLAFSFCRYRAGEIALTPPPSNGEKAELLGVVRLCKAGDRCDSIPAEVRAAFGAVSRRALEASRISEIESIRLGNAQARWIPAN